MFGLGGGGNEMEVVINGDASSLQSALTASMSQIESFKGAVAGLGLAMSALAAGGIKESVSAARDWNAVQREMTKVTDPQTAQDLGDAIRNMADDMPIATTELGKIATEAARFGITGTDNISSFTESVAKMAFATDVSINEAGQAFARLSVLTQTPVSSIENLGSSINTMGQTTATSSKGIVDGMLRSAAALNQLGMSAPDIVGLQASLNAVSESSSRAGTRLRRLATEMMDPRNVQDLASALGMSADEFVHMRDTAPTQTLLKLADTLKAGGDGADILSTTISSVALAALRSLAQNTDAVRQNLDNANQSFQAGTSLSREYAIENQSLGSAIQKLKNTIDDVAITIGNQFLPYLKDATSVLQDAAVRFKELNAQTHGAAAAVVLVVTALAGIIPTLGLMITMSGPAIAALTGIGAAAAEIYLPIIALVAVAALLYEAWTTNFMGIRDITQQVFSAITQAFQTISSTLAPVVQNALSQMTSFWNAHAQQVFAAVSKIQQILQSVFGVALQVAENTVQSGLQMMTNLWNQHGQAVTQRLITFTNAVMALFTKIFNAIMPIVQNALSVILTFWTNHGQQVITILTATFNGIVSVVGAALDIVITIFETALDFISGILTAAVQLWNGDWSGALNTLKQTAFTVLTDISGLWQRILTGITTFITTWGGKIIQSVIGILQGIFQGFVTFGQQLIFGSLVKDIFNAILQFVTGIMTTIQTAITTALNAIKTVFTTILGAIKTVVTTAWTAIKTFITTTINAIRTIITTVWTAIKTFITTTINAIKTVITTVWNAIKTVVTTVMNAIHTMFVNVWNTIKTAITNTVNTIKTTLTNVWNSIKTTLTNTMNTVHTMFTNTWNTIKDTIGRITDTIHTNLSNTWNTIKSTLTTTMGNIHTMFTNTWNTIKDTITRITNTIHSTLTDTWNTIKSTLTTIVNTIKTNATNAFNTLKTNVTNAINTVKTNVTNAMNTAKSNFSSALSSMKSTASRILGEIISAFSSAFDRVKSIAGDIISTAEDAASRARSALSSARSAASSAASRASSAARSAASAASSAISAAVGNIPGMQHGGIVTGPTLAMIGEGRGPEAVIPLSKLGSVMQTTAGTRPAGSGPSIQQVNVYANDAQGGRDAARAFARTLRSYGFD